MTPPAAARHPHLADELPEGRVRVDMHMHTMWSGDATTTPDELRVAVADTAIDVLCITDHATINGAVTLARELPCRVVVGEEVRTASGELIGLFLTERLPAGLTAWEAAGRIRAQGGIVYVPHPYDPTRHCLEGEVLCALVGDGLVDAVEVFNAKTSLQHLNRRAAALADEAELAIGAGSDAHEPTAIGAAYVEMDDFSDAPSFLAALGTATPVGHHYDAPRVWTPRIVPSTRRALDPLPDAVPSQAVPLLHAIILGITQGLSEFLPISSSGHLILVPWLFGWHDFVGSTQLEKTFDVALHIGTLIGALAYLRNDVVRLVRAAWHSLMTRSITTATERLAWLLLLSAVPGVIVGGLFDNFITDHLGQPALIGAMLIVFGLLLMVADRQPEKRTIDEYETREALLMGAAQAVALQPGVSRSGATITMGRFLGFHRDAAARISFLMALPITAGAVVYKGAKLFKDGGIPAGFGPAFFWGIVASAITGFIAVWGLLKLVRTHSFTPFVIYRIVLGTAVIVIAATSWR